MYRNYLRCSTDEQTTASQRHAIDGWLHLNNREGLPVTWYDDTGKSGVDKHRPALTRMMRDLRPGETVLVYAVDRMTRGGIVATLQLRDQIRGKGAKLFSISEPW